MFEKGDILTSKRTGHPIIFLNWKDEDFFHGCIITSAKAYTDNIPFLLEHFEVVDDQGNPHNITFQNSKFVNVRLIKNNEWGPYIKSGKLSRIGIEFVENHLEDKEPIDWETYLSIDDL